MALPIKQTSEARMDEQARALTKKALDTIEEIMMDGEKDSDRLAAAKEALSRGYGTPISATIALPATKRAVAHLMGMADEDLERMALADPEPVAVIEHKPPSQEFIDALDSISNSAAKLEPVRSVTGVFAEEPDTPAATAQDFDEQYLDDEFMQ